VRRGWSKERVGGEEDLEGGFQSWGVPAQAVELEGRKIATALPNLLST